MTATDEPTLAELQEAAASQQTAAAAAVGSAYISACPGAGKTHVVATRHLQSPAQPLRSGRALISFTRVARDQMARRCREAGRSDLVLAPHFIGTFDSFLWDFLAKPLRPADPAPRLLESWAGVKAQVKLDRTVSLGQMQLTLNITGDSVQECVAWDLLDSDTQRMLNSSNRSRNQWEQAVLAARNAWCRRGYYTGHEARYLALRNMRSAEKAQWLLPPLKSRFAEVIVDEAQDCSGADLAILELLHDAGLPLVLVGDPDQAIYAWRGAEPKALQDFARRISAREIPLTGNRRSTPVICRLASTLRAGPRPPDIAVVRRDLIPVAVFPTRFAPKGGQHLHATSANTVIEAFRDHAQQHGIAADQCLLTAHKYATLPGASRERPGANPLTTLAWAHSVVHTPGADANHLTRACATAARALIGYWFPQEASSPEGICADLGIPVSRLHRTAFAFLYDLPTPHPGWSSDVWQAMKAWPPLPGAAPQGGKGRLAGTPTIPRATADIGMRTAIVHQVKGDEADAVLLFLPDADTVQRWTTCDPSTDEQLRIWYVAVTRARRLAALAVPEDQAAALTRFLAAREVPHQIR
ncbi:UvrD-helicase domain-containing protein [Actinacidiphila acididurans]|uniref:UvrD-helicase domain-containing protein n=1 Tax=Actinacidiphila acididurans TaxID=2784346 RepID=A0ABS2TU05_9ACTN|nr:UvrD-helicase domain-containing protein [Actinacidiphila acididurans]MBM9506811.1 UvrD-helicase domain-containing protein [Actinacidiphila acididurans]